MTGAYPGAGTRQVGAYPSGDSATRLIGDVVDRPTASAGNSGYTFAATDTGVLYQSTGSTWIAIADFGGGG